ncbi:MAG: tetratricopeptide repeat protein [Magnetococcales bacterium]|nr:tetratricopeptide repeat protein [Magnetococcales bacterium]MBF0631069.1 tetratricopeptide repeat protein [Magnetococcales bacterium]
MSLISQLLKDLHQRQAALEIDVLSMGIEPPRSPAKVQRLRPERILPWVLGVFLLSVGGVAIRYWAEQRHDRVDPVANIEQNGSAPVVSAPSEPTATPSLRPLSTAPTTPAATIPVTGGTPVAPANHGAMASMAVEEESVAPSGMIMVPESPAIEPAQPVANSPLMRRERGTSLGLATTPPKKSDSDSIALKQVPFMASVPQQIPEVSPIRRRNNAVIQDGLATMALDNPHGSMVSVPRKPAEMQVARANPNIVENSETILPLQKAQTLAWARTLLEDGQLDEAERVVQEHLAQDGQSTSALGIMAELEQKRGNLEAANRYYNRLLRLEPDRYRWWLGLATNLDQAKRGKEAISFYKHVLKMENVDDHVLRFARERLRALEGKTTP